MDPLVTYNYENKSYLSHLFDTGCIPATSFLGGKTVDLVKDDEVSYPSTFSRVTFSINLIAAPIASMFFSKGKYTMPIVTAMSGIIILPLVIRNSFRYLNNEVVHVEGRKKNTEMEQTNKRLQDKVSELEEKIKQLEYTNEQAKSDFEKARKGVKLDASGTPHGKKEDIEAFKRVLSSPQVQKVYNKSPEKRQRAEALVKEAVEEEDEDWLVNQEHTSTSPFTSIFQDFNFDNII